MKKVIKFIFILFSIISPTSGVFGSTAEPYYTIYENQSNKDVSLSLSPIESSFFRAASQQIQSLIRFLTHEDGLLLPQTPYARTQQFGRWINEPNDNSCLNTRGKVLIRDSQKEVTYKNERHCTVDTGLWMDPYTKNELTKAKDIQIDHLIPLKHAWISGAWKWDFRARCLFANFLHTPYHLLPVLGRVNMSKGDRAPQDFLPPNKNYICTYLENWLKVKLTWKLVLTEEEKSAISQAINENQCPLEAFQITQNELKEVRMNLYKNIDYCVQNQHLMVDSNGI